MTKNRIMKIETILKIADSIREAEKQNGTLEYSLPKNEYREWIPIEQLNYNEDLDKIVLRIRVTEQIKQPTKRLPTIEEVEKWFLDNVPFKIEGKECYQRIISIDKEHSSEILIGDSLYYSIGEFCTYYRHLDGTELYITEN